MIASKMLTNFINLLLWLCLTGVGFGSMDDENVVGSLSMFHDFHKCIVDVASKPHAQHIKCRDTKQCFDKLFDMSEEYLTRKMELKVKMDIEIDLNKFSDCKDIFTSAANESLQCQLTEIGNCVNRPSSSDLCGRLKSQSYCLGPYSINCSRRIFPSILRRISVGMWESLKCHDPKDLDLDFRRRSEDDDKFYQSTGTPYTAKKTSYVTPSYLLSTYNSKSYRMHSTNSTYNITGRDGAHMNHSARNEESINDTRLDRGYPMHSGEEEETSPPSGRGNEFYVTSDMYNMSARNAEDDNSTLKRQSFDHSLNTTNYFNDSKWVPVSHPDGGHSFFSRDFLEHLNNSDPKDLPFNFTDDSNVKKIVFGELDFARKAHSRLFNASSTHDQYLNGTVRRNLLFFNGNDSAHAAFNESSGRIFDLFIPKINLSGEHNYTSTTFPPRGRQFDSSSETTAHLSSTPHASSSSSDVVSNVILILAFAVISLFY